jgi:hypothetical protein
MRNIIILFLIVMVAGCANIPEEPGKQPSGELKPEIPTELKGLSPGVATGDSFPIVIEQVPPVYPEPFKKNKIAGEAVIEMIVEVNGTVHITHIVSQTDKAFGAAAAACVKMWRSS